ncbi:MAG: protein tyrosine phosphatase family protein [Planctomycetota bacterium]|nr:protein tyrosine phosphatase family protein [Planctomycetota bacterium]MDA1113123.1 protein tyrosine phosphatase family protein [Planctomycetota bacterium]
MSKAILLLASLLLGAASCSSSEIPTGHERPTVGSLFDSEVPPQEVDIRNYTILSNQVAGGGAISAEQVATLPSKGYTTIINLRFEHEDGVKEEMAAADAAGLTYVSIPVSGSDFTLGHAKRVSDAIAASPGHVLFHCASGGRVTAVWALTRAIEEGLSPEEAARVANEEGCRPIPEPMVHRVVTELQAAR